MLRAAVLNDSPVLFLENKVCYAARPKISPESMADDFFVYYAGDAGAPIVCLSLTQFEDETATLLCYGGALPVAMEAAVRLLTEFEISVRILAPGRLYPLEVEGMGGLIVPGSPVLSLEEGAPAAGFGAEVFAALSEKFPGKISRFCRIGARELPVAAARSLEESILPQVDEIVRSIRALAVPGAQDEDL
jgi:pyruvate/2-oxoglutarate/acetoin dehydrogenase E1 component